MGKSYQLLKTKKHYLAIFFIMYGLLFLVTLLDYPFLQQQIATHYEKTIEKKIASELLIYSETLEEQFSSYYTHVTWVLENLAKDTDFVRLVQKGDFVTIKSILQRERVVNDNFDTMSLIDVPLKRFVVISSIDAYLETVTPTDISTKEHYKTTGITGKTNISSLYKSSYTPYYLQTISAAIPTKGKTQYYFTGVLQMEHLSKKIHPAVGLENMSYVLLDKSGTIIIENNKTTRALKNITTTDLVARRLVNGDSDVFLEERNYAGELVFAKGSKIGQQNPLYLIAYYPKHEFNQEAETIRTEVNRIYLGILLRQIGIVFLAFILVIWIIKTYEKKHN